MSVKIEFDGRFVYLKKEVQGKPGQFETVARLENWFGARDLVEEFERLQNKELDMYEE